jgi:uncharacterized membrane protein
LTVEELLSKKFLRLELGEWIVLFMVSAYSAIFSYYTIMKYYSFRYGAWDFGTLVQSIASSFKGKLFINNVERYYSPTGSYFGVHFSPILFIVLPFFALSQRAETILIFQSIILALGSFPVYFICKHNIGNRKFALTMSTIYLLNPALQGINWYDFTPQTFIPFFILIATYFLKKRKLFLFIFFTVMSLITLEQALYFIAVYNLYVIWELRTEIKKIFSSKDISLRILIKLSPSPIRRIVANLTPSYPLLTPIITFAIIIFWGILSSNIKNMINPNPPIELLAIGNYRILKITSIMEIPVKVLMNPDLLIEAINFDFPSKIIYVLLSLAPSCFISFLSPIALLPSFIWLFLSSVSNWPPYYQFGFHYPAFTFPFIIIATIDGVKSLINNMNKRDVEIFNSRICVLFLGVNLAISLFACPLSLVHKVGDFRYFRDYGISYPSSLCTTLINVLEELPEDALIVTSSHVFSHMSTRINVYVIPPKNKPSERLYNTYLNYLKGIDFDYVIINYFFWDKYEAEELYNIFIKNNNKYGLFIEGAGFEIYKKDYVSDSIKLPLRFSYKELCIKDSKLVDDSSSESGKVIMLPESSTSRNAWWGPYITLRPGNYTAIFRIKVDALPLDGKIIKLDVWSNTLQKTIAYLKVMNKDIYKPLVWHTFTLKFTITTRVENIEFRGVEASSGITVWLDYVEVYPS